MKFKVVPFGRIIYYYRITSPLKNPGDHYQQKKKNTLKTPLVLKIVVINNHVNIIRFYFLF